jgi:arylsulfatase A-like enzyme
MCPSIRRCSLLALAFALAGCGRPAAPSVVIDDPPPASPSRYPDCNLVFVSFDALQAAHVGSLGYPRNVTPTIDGIAKQSVSFTHAYSVASWTVPASMTWFTGVFPSEHRMVNKFALYTPDQQKPAKLKELAPNLITLAEVLKKNGYATGGFTGNAGVSGGFGYEAGFDTYQHEFSKFGSFEWSMPRALKWLEANKHKKFFLFLHGYDCHGQYSPAEGYDRRFVEKGYDNRYTGSGIEQEILREEGLTNGKLSLRDADVKFWRAVYDEKIQRADARFKQFLDAFEKLGVSDRTLFVLTSDHGTEVYEHRRMDHGFTLYDEQLHVPLIVKLPGRSEERRIDHRVSSVDVMPTILELLDVDAAGVKEQFRGTSLVPAIHGTPPNRDCFSETDYREYTFKRSIISPDGWKLIATMESKRRELFDLNTDPGELNDVSGRHPERVRELEARLFANYKRIGHDLAARKWEPGLNPVYPSQGKK